MGEQEPEEEEGRSQEEKARVETGRLS